MTDTTDLPHSRACGIRCNGHGAACSKDCPTCAGHPDWTPEQQPERASGRVRATIAVEKLCGWLPKLGPAVRTEGAALTTDELADVLEALNVQVAALISRASAAEAERDHYREAIEGGRAWLGLVVPELVYPQRVVLGADVDPADLEDWRATGGIYALPPDPLTVLQQEVAELTAAVAQLVAQGEPFEPAPDFTACRADEMCEASHHYIACPAFTYRVGH